MADDLGERTEEATPKRRQESRDDGKVAKSQDLSAVILLVIGTIAVGVAAMWMIGEGKNVIGNVLAGETAADPFDPDTAWETVLYTGAAALRIAAPVMLVLWGAAYLANFGQIGWLFSPKSIQPKASKLNPIAGFKRIFGISMLVKVSLDSMKIVLVMVIAIVTVRQYADQILLLPYLSVLGALTTVGGMMLDLALRLLAVLLILGVIDLAYQRWKQSQELKMTKQQVKDEMKQTEGDPEVKKRRMRMQQQIAMQRISAAVPKADVIVTNPEHISIAIKYDDDMHAPRVLAKGADHLAMRIRQIALKHGIPIIERKPLARALYKEIAVGQEIPPAFYTAVAEVLAYVYRLSGRMAG